MQIPSGKLFDFHIRQSCTAVTPTDRAAGRKPKLGAPFDYNPHHLRESRWPNHGDRGHEWWIGLSQRMETQVLITLSLAREEADEDQ